MILVFKTSIKSRKAVRQVTPVLNGILENGKWNFDLSDCDNILRVVTNKNITNNIITALLLEGFECRELH